MSEVFVEKKTRTSDDTGRHRYGGAHVHTGWLLEGDETEGRKIQELYFPHVFLLFFLPLHFYAQHPTQKTHFPSKVHYLPEENQNDGGGEVVADVDVEED